MTAQGKSVALLLGLQCLTKGLRAPPAREEPRVSSSAPRTARAPGGGRLGGHLSAPPPGRGSAVAAGGEEEKEGQLRWGVEEIWEQLEQQVRGELLSCTASIIQADSAELFRAASPSLWAEAAF